MLDIIIGTPRDSYQLNTSELYSHSSLLYHTSVTRSMRLLLTDYKYEECHIHHRDTEYSSDLQNKIELPEIESVCMKRAEAARIISTIRAVN